jgi:hypothetical protein
LSYSGTAAASTGATSWLHLLLLVPGRLLGLKDAAFVVFPVLLGVVYLALTLHGVRRAAAAMAPGGGAGHGPAGSGGGPGGSVGGPRGANGAPGRLRALLPPRRPLGRPGVIGLSGHYLWGASSMIPRSRRGLALTLAAVAQPGARRVPLRLLPGCGRWARGGPGAGVLG